MIEPRHHGQMAGDRNGMEREYFGDMTLTNIYSDHFEGRHLLPELVKQSLIQMLLLLLFLMSW